MRHKTKHSLKTGSQDLNHLIKPPTYKCKNCSTEIEGHYCHFCGQAYHDHKESFGELVYEFVSDFLHFDSRLFKTVLPLLLKPGKLTKSYNEGKQLSQFHPIRLYLFSSFVYFFLFFYFNNPETKFEPANYNPDTYIRDSSVSLNKKDSTLLIEQKTQDPESPNEILAGKPITIPNSGQSEFVTLKDSSVKYSFTVSAYIDSLMKKRVSPEEYLKIQNSPGKNKKDGFLSRIITIRLLTINLEGDAGKREFFKKVLEKFLHNIPKMLFFLLPVFALLLKLLYIRGKQFYFVDHAILSLHYFSFIFLLLIISHFILDKILNTTFFTSMASIWILIYLLLAMKRLYLQSWGKTIVKYAALGFLFVISVAFTLAVNMAWSAFIM